MKSSYPTVFLLTCYFALAFSSLIPPPSLPPSSPHPPPPPPPPPPPQSPPPLLPPVNPLPAEKDGVLPDGTVTNATPANATDSTSCWTKPVDPPILGIDHLINPGRCQVCVIQNGTSAEPTNHSYFELWVRDDKNQAIGGIDPQTLAPIHDDSPPTASISLAAGGKQLSLWTELNAENSHYTVVNMALNIRLPEDAESEAVMQFNPNPVPATNTPKGGNHCMSIGSAEDDAVMYFQCSFQCS